MKKFIYVLSFIFFLMLGCAMPQAHADFAERPVGFVVLDYGNNVDTAFYKDMYDPVKWAYHIPNYRVIEDDNLINDTKEAMTGRKVKVTPELMKALAEKHKMDVLVVAKIYDVSEILAPLIFSNYDADNYIRVTCAADLYCYRLDSNKLLVKRLRDSFIADGPYYEKPRQTVKWQLSKLVNTMEGRPIIGE